MTDTSRKNLLKPAIVAAIVLFPTAALLARFVFPRASRNEDKSISVPFELLDSNHILVKAKVNGKGPYNMIFDVGAPICLLSSKAGEESGAVKPGAAASFIFNMKGEAEIAHLSVGGVEAENVPAVVLDHPLLKALSQIIGKRLDGIVGYTFFARYRTAIDYQAKTLTFTPVDFRPGNIFKDLEKRLSSPKVAKERVASPEALWGLEFARQAAGEPAEGVRIEKVFANSPAAKGGIVEGDLVAEIDGRWTFSPIDAATAVERIAPGKPTKIVIIRDGKNISLVVNPTLGL